MDVAKIRRDFPILDEEIDGKPLVYLDSACQTLRPKQVVDSMDRYYNEFPACAGRSVHRLATSVSIEIDIARERIAKFVNAARPEEVCFMRNCTEALNAVIFGIELKKGDTVVTSDREHNSVHVPLIVLKEERGIEIVRTPSKPDESFNIDRFSELVSDKKPKLVVMCHTSNVNGTTIPAEEISKIAREGGSKVLFDGAQYAPHGEIDLEKIGCDFYAFSMHKMCGPSGVGILAGDFSSLSKLRPLVFGGHGVQNVTKDKAELLGPPERFEPGLQNYSGMIGSGVAAEYIRSIGREEITEHVSGLNRVATEHLNTVPGVEVLAPLDPTVRGGILPFNIKGRNPHDVAMMLDHNDNIMIRSGSHCAHSFFDVRRIEGAARASFYIYNTKSESRYFAESIASIAK